MVRPFVRRSHGLKATRLTSLARAAYSPKRSSSLSLAFTPIGPTQLESTSVGPTPAQERSFESKMQVRLSPAPLPPQLTSPRRPPTRKRVPTSLLTVDLPSSNSPPPTHPSNPTTSPASPNPKMRTTRLSSASKSRHTSASEPAGPRAKTRLCTLLFRRSSRGVLTSSRTSSPTLLQSKRRKRRRKGLFWGGGRSTGRAWLCLRPSSRRTRRMERRAARMRSAARRTTTTMVFALLADALPSPALSLSCVPLSHPLRSS